MHTFEVSDGDRRVLTLMVLCELIEHTLKIGVDEEKESVCISCIIDSDSFAAYFYPGLALRLNSFYGTIIKTLKCFLSAQIHQVAIEGGAS